MTAVDDYLRRIAFWLPARNRADVLQELRGALDEKLEAAEAAQGRALTKEEAGQVLAGFGHPAIMVARYAEGSPVISGGLAYFFWRVLWVALGGVFGAQAILFVMEAARAPLPPPMLAEILGRTLFALLLAFAVVTSTFMILERRWGRSRR